MELDKKEEARLEESREKREREVSLECECEFYMAEQKRKMTTVDWGLMNDCQEISSGINGFETSLGEWYTLNAKCVFNENYCEKFEKKFHEVLEDVGQS